MALITCDECGRQISDKSVACPHCGYPTHLNKGAQAPVADTEQNVSHVVVPEGVEAEPSESVVSKVVITQPLAPEAAEPVVSKVVMPQEPAHAPTPAPESNDDTAVPEPQKPDPRRNERIKLWVFLGIFFLVALVVLVCYFLGARAGESPSDLLPADSITEQTDSVGAPDSVPATTPGKSTRGIDKYVPPKTQPAPPSDKDKGATEPPSTGEGKSSGNGNVIGDPTVGPGGSTGGGSGSGGGNGSSDKDKSTTPDPAKKITLPGTRSM